MANTTKKITDEELRTKLQDSYLEQSQKAQLKELIPHMNEADRNQLLSLIAQSHQVKNQEDKADAKAQADLMELNLEYDQKMNQLGKELNKKVLTEYEDLHKSEEEKQLKGLEAEFK